MRTTMVRITICVPCTHDSAFDGKSISLKTCAFFSDFTGHIPSELAQLENLQNLVSIVYFYRSLNMVP